MENAIRQLLKLPQAIELHIEPVTGGDICQSFKVQISETESYFIKTQEASLRSMFEAEQTGLHALRQHTDLHIPKPLGILQQKDTLFFAMTFLDFQQPHDPGQRKLGRELAALHRNENHRHGFESDNFIGLTPQKNAWMNSWTNFWIRCRLDPQFERLKEKGVASDFLKTAERFCDKATLILEGHNPTPSFLHGDLWSGNYGICTDGVPALYDPAVYFGDRETDLAMTELFGGFSQGFYDAYNEAWPLDSGYKERKTFYNIYHILNHANIFGGRYLAQAQSEMEAFL